MRLSHQGEFSLLAAAGSSLLVLVMLLKAVFPKDIIPSYNSGGSHLAEKVSLSLFFRCTRGGLEQSTSQSTAGFIIFLPAPQESCLSNQGHFQVSRESAMPP